MNGGGSDFFLDEDPFFSSADRCLADTFVDDFVELLWDNGPVLRRTPPEEPRGRGGSSPAAPPVSEDEEMRSWLPDAVGSGFSPSKPKLFPSSGSKCSANIGSSVTSEGELKVPGDQKRKSAEPEDSVSISESTEKLDESGRSASKKRQRAAAVHNLSERKRRDRINERMKTLQALVPGCNKSDKASMLDDAIRYMKFLKNHVQMMSMGSPIFPMMVPGAHTHQYYPQMAVPSMPMGMNMGMAVGTYGVPLFSGFQAAPSSPSHQSCQPGLAPACPDTPSSPRR